MQLVAAATLCRHPTGLVAEATTVSRPETIVPTSCERPEASAGASADAEAVRPVARPVGGLRFASARRGAALPSVATILGTSGRVWAAEAVATAAASLGGAIR